MDKTQGPLPEIPPKRYFTIGEVGELCGVKPYVLRYWEQEFTQLRPVKRRGNRRYYQHHEVLLIRRICELLYEQGFTISGARNRLAAGGALAGETAASPAVATAERLPAGAGTAAPATSVFVAAVAHAAVSPPSASVPLEDLPGSADAAPWSEGLLRRELLSIRQLLEV
jgi:DNA-binding transcriptional MerR regulator